VLIKMTGGMKLVERMVSDLAEAGDLELMGDGTVAFGQFRGCRFARP
jgi:hypothetical protein